MAMTNLVLSSWSATAAALRRIWVDLFLLCSVMLHVCGLVSSLAHGSLIERVSNIDTDCACMGIREVSAFPFTYSVMSDLHIKAC